MSSAFMGTGKADFSAQNGNSPEYMSYYVFQTCSEILCYISQNPPVNIKFLLFSSGLCLILYC